MTTTAPPATPPTLQADRFRPLPLGAVRPAGWLLDQLRLQADGMSGGLDEFWPSLKDSAWIGGRTEAWERGPYWLDGIIPLAVLLDDPSLHAKVRYWIDYILAHQREDGWLGPVLKGNDGQDVYDTWPLFVLFKAMTQWYSATADERIIPAMARAMRFILDHIRREPIFGWGQYRTADLVLSVHWLYHRTGEAWLLELASLIEQQGYDWVRLYGDYPYTTKTPDLVVGAGAITGSHGPNAAMGLKHPAVRFRGSGSEADRDAVFAMIATLDRYHGQASGVFTCDEHLAGRAPTQGTELCAVVEYLFSLETVIAVLGERAASLGDRLERIAFNALPAAFSPDMWAHQYDQQANQVVAKRFAKPVWTDNNGEANTFGLEPHYGCCTANYHQGWPKFAAHQWMQRADDEALVALSYAPATVRAAVGGTAVTVDVAGEYPFSDTITVTVATDRPVRVPLLLRIPDWAYGATIDVAGEHYTPSAGTFGRVEVAADARPVVLTVRLPMAVRLERRDRHAVAVHRGPLLFALKIGERWERFRGEFPHCDYEVFPQTPWNLALELDHDRPDASFTIWHRPPGRDAFSPEGAPVTLVGRGRLLPGWRADPTHEVAAEPPLSPVAADGQAVRVDLIPFGAAKLRVTELPWTTTASDPKPTL